MIERLDPQEWSEISERMNFEIFGEYTPKDKERIDYALLYGVGKEPRGFVTCRELDAETVYWQFGGLLPEYRGTLEGARGQLEFIEYARERYKRVSLRIENENVHYLTMVLKLGFRIVGTLAFGSTVLVQLVLEFGGEDGSSRLNTTGRGIRYGSSPRNRDRGRCRSGPTEGTSDRPASGPASAGSGSHEGSDQPIHRSKPGY